MVASTIVAIMAITPSCTASAWSEIAAKPAKMVMVNVLALALNPDMRVMAPWIIPKCATLTATLLSGVNAVTPPLVLRELSMPLIPQSRTKVRYQARHGQAQTTEIGRYLPVPSCQSNNLTTPSDSPSIVPLASGSPNGTSVRSP